MSDRRGGFELDGVVDVSRLPLPDAVARIGSALAGDPQDMADGFTLAASQLRRRRPWTWRLIAPGRDWNGQLHVVRRRWRRAGFSLAPEDTSATLVALAAKRAPLIDPVHPCRLMATRGCPLVYAGVCGPRPCARFESDDERPWLESFELERR